MPLGCEIEGCGIGAFARCGTCGSAYCRSHAGQSEHSLLVDRCRPCQDTESRRRDVESGWAHRHFFEAEAAVRLEAAGVPKAPVYQAHLVDKIDSRRWRSVKASQTEWRVAGHCWYLGPCEMNYDVAPADANAGWSNATRVDSSVPVYLLPNGNLEVGNANSRPTLIGWKQLVTCLLRVTGTSWDPYAGIPRPPGPER